MKIIIVGALGNLGTQLVKVFSQKKANEVFAFDRDDLDVTKKKEVISKVKAIYPNVIINAVAYNAVDLCEENLEEFKKAQALNTLAPQYLAEVARKIGAFFIHYSTDYVFSGKKRMGYRESDRPNPLNNYGKSKFLGEQAVLQEGGKGLSYYLIRTSKLFGPRGQAENSKPSFFDQVLKTVEEKKELRLISDEEVSCFTYTVDLAKKTQELLEKKFPIGIYHLINTGVASWFDGAKYLLALKKKTDIQLISIKSQDLKRPAKRPSFSVLKNTKTIPLRNWQEALREYLKQ